MMTDTDTTPYRETVGGKTYYFCSEGCQAKFDKAPASYVALNTGLAAGIAPVYRLGLNTPPQTAPNRPSPLSSRSAKRRRAGLCMTLRPFTRSACT